MTAHPRKIFDYLARRVADSNLMQHLMIRHQPFRARYRQRFCATQTDPPMAIDADPGPEEMRALFNHIQRSWQRLGETEPHWSVLTNDKFKRETIGATGEDFYATGRNQLEDLECTLERNGIDRKSLRTCLEYGCGVGRVTHWLARNFEEVHGYDISQSHLRLAEQAMAARGLTNVRFHHVSDISALDGLPKADLVYTVIVLQHNPPPLIAVMIRGLLRALTPGGVAYFQVPTYRKGYSFLTRTYLASQGAKPESMEMHVLPQPTIFRIIAEEGCRPLEVLEDTYTGLNEKELSSTFLVQRN